MWHDYLVEFWDVGQVWSFLRIEGVGCGMWDVGFTAALILGHQC